MVYEFTSYGNKGEVSKIIQYSETNLKGMFNLAFGDKISGTDELDDKVITDNGDSEKILATVVASVYAFTDKYQDVWVYATGSSKSRTRLYRIGITKYLPEIEMDFDIYGLHEGEWEYFEKGIVYEAFLVKRKIK